MHCVKVQVTNRLLQKACVLHALMLLVLKPFSSLFIAVLLRSYPQ